MVQIEQLAEAVLKGEAVEVRSLAQDFLRANPNLAAIAQPRVDDVRLLAISASLLELFALRLRQEAPAWTKRIEPLPEPIYLLKSAAKMRRLRELCKKESPEPFRKRGFFVPPNYLEFA